MKYLYSSGQTFASGLLLAFAYPNMFGEGFSFLAIVSFGFFYYYLLKEQTLKSLLLQTFFYALGFSTFGFYWIPQTLSTFGGIDISLGYVVSLFFALIVLPQLWPQVLCVYFFKKFKFPQVTYLILLACTHVLFEQITPSQFPVWIGHSILSNNTLLPLTAYFGAGIYSFAFLLMALFFPLLIANIKKPAKPFLLGLSILILDFVLGHNTHYPTTQNTKSINQLRVRIVQANIGNFLKLSSENGELNSIANVYKNYEELSFNLNNNIDKNFDLLLWPETAIPTLFNTKNWKDENFENFPLIKNIIDQLPPQAGFIFGGYDEGNSELSQNSARSEFNTAFFYQDKKFETYYKVKLIPFGETLPFGSWNETLAPYFPGISLFSQGPKLNSFALHHPLRSSEKIHFITPICYELLDTFFMRKFLNVHSHVEFIANLTNDSWYGDTAEPWQHLFLTRWRALEFRRPILRSTNTGITTVIDEQGKITKYLGINDKNILDITLNLHSLPITIYQQWGSTFLYIFMVGLILIYLVRPAFIKSCKRKTPSKT